MVGGASEYERGISTAPFILAQVATAASPPPTNPDMIRYLTPGMPLTPKQSTALSGVYLTTEEQSDNNRYDLLMQAVPNQPTNQMARVSYWWPASFFEQNGQQISLVYLLNPALTQNALVPKFYQNGLTLTKFGKQSKWFKVWSSPDLQAGFIYRKGDIVNFGGGHTTIVAGDNTYNDVVISQMSYNRTRQTYRASTAFYDDFPLTFDDYGVTRDKLSDLRSGLGPAKIAGIGRPENAFTERDYTVYRLMPWLRAPDPQFYRLNQLTMQAQRPYKQYTVLKGETLSEIAQKPAVQSTVAALAEANGIADPDFIQTGDILFIP